MRYCRHCGVMLENDIGLCPLCDMETEKRDDSFELAYPYVKSRFTRGLLIKMITFLAIVFAGVSLLIDHLVPTGNPWAVITVAAIVYVWYSAMAVLRETPNPASIMLAQLYGVSGLTVFLDYITGWYKWSLNYVIPGLIIAAALATTLIIVIRPMKFRAFTIYLLVIAVLGVLSILLWLFGFSEEWPVVTAATVAGLCFLTVLVFFRRKTGNELQKRFHV